MGLESWAGEATGKVKEILVRDDGLHYFFLDTVAAPGKPACAIYGYWMIKDENSTAGKTQISMLLTAQASGRPLNVRGKNTCTRWYDGEDVALIILGQ
jgi:hypothetical protein